MKIATWNVNSLSVRLPHVLDWLGKHKPNVLCIQETKMVDEKFPVDKFSELGYHCSYAGEKAYNGVAVISDCTPDSIQKGFRPEGEFTARRFLEVTIGPVHIINVYVPNGSQVGSEKFFYKLRWLEKLAAHLYDNHRADELLALCGDYNIAPEDRDVFSVEQMTGQILFSDQEHAALEAIRSWGLTDSFRIHQPEGGHYSWWDYRLNAFKRKMGLRIDHIWVSKPMAEKCTGSLIDIEPRKLERPSDHAPIISEFSGI